MGKRLQVADGTNEVVRLAADDANCIQDACNMRGILGSFHRHMLALGKLPENDGDSLNNHPVALAFISKLVSLSRLNDGVRESDALGACTRLAAGEQVEFEVIELA